MTSLFVTENPSLCACFWYFSSCFWHTFTKFPNSNSRQETSESDLHPQYWTEELIFFCLLFLILSGSFLSHQGWLCHLMHAVAAADFFPVPFDELEDTLFHNVSNCFSWCYILGLADHLELQMM